MVHILKTQGNVVCVFFLCMIELTVAINVAEYKNSVCCCK
jgi:hypothetical protein